jgi:hypothetical protein
MKMMPKPMTPDAGAEVGVERSPEWAAALRACEETVYGFCEFLDDGDIDRAYGLHHDDLRFFPVGSPQPVDKQAAIEGALAVRLAYPGRRTLHLASNFIGRPLPNGTIEARYAMTVWELTERDGDGARQLPTPVIFALAQEHAIFRRDDAGSWKFVEERMLLVAPWRDADGPAV